MSTIPRAEATLDDLARFDQKAELIDGEIVVMSPTGFTPGYAGDEIFAALRAYAKRTGAGIAIGDNKAFRVDLPKRKSFSPDAAFYVGPATGMKFLEGAPLFAVEVRSEHDYGPNAERQIKAKRADYFAAGTRVVWDVDLLNEEVIHSYSVEASERPVVFRRGENAHAESALPDWSLPVDDLFYEPPAA
ncbi:MAG: Uma2 family endonuclease [Pirellulales bacterium]